MEAQQSEVAQRPTSDRSSRVLTSVRLHPRPYGTIAFLAVFAAVALALPTFSGKHVVGLVTLVLVFSIVNMAWNLLLGYAGVSAFGQLAFFAVGAYAAAYLNLNTALPLWASIPIAAAIGGLVGLALGMPSLRLYGPYMVLFTLAFQLVLAGLVEADVGGLTGGPLGLQGLEPISFLGLSASVATLYIGALLFVLVYVAIALLLRSPIGAALQAVRDSREAAEARGVNLYRHRLALFTISAAFTALSGAFYAHYVTVVVPTVLSLSLLLSLLAMLMLGGLGTQVGPFVGTLVLVYLNDSLSTTAEYRQLIWGTLIVVIALLLPGGMVGTAARLGGRARSRVRDWVGE